jgi:predicted AlkP superfamily phosphohydrolase/phosphomutase
MLIGLDGACQPVLNRVFEADVAPRLQSLCGSGVAGPLESQLPPWTPSAWPSIYTGVNPGKHGVYGFLQFEGYDWDVVDRTAVEEFTCWETLDRNGYTSVVVNAPVTHPPRPIDGAVVPGYVSPEPPPCHPEGVLDEIEVETGPYEIYPPKRGSVSDDEQVAAFCRLVEQRADAFAALTRRFDPDFGFLQFQQTDTVFHERPGDWDAIERVYATVDDQLARLLDRFDPDTVVVVSDHGIGEYTGYEFRVNDFLRDAGYLETRRGGDGMPSWDSIARNELRTDGQDGSVPDHLFTRAFAGLSRVGLTAQRLERALDAVGLASVVGDVMPTDAIRAAAEQVDFAASRAYMRDRIELGVRVNLAGRDPEGVVARADYDRVRRELEAALEDVTTPAGDPVFEAVRPREAVFEGPHLDRAPDLILVPAAFDHFLSASVRGEQFAQPTESWNHKREGIVVAQGDGIDTDATLGDAHIFDIAPTVLATFGVPPSERMDGTPLTFVDAPSPRQYPAFNARESRQTTSDEVAQHLANLGYLEDP